ncbi:MAG: hypothetical protein ACOCYC_02335 [bacterium]
MRITHRSRLLTVLVILIFLALGVGTVSAETVRGSLAGVLEVGDEDGTESIEFRPEGVVGLRLSPGLRFLEGVQLELSIPQAAREVAGGLGLYVYAAPTAPLDGSVQTREGRRLFFLPLPARSRVLIQVPLTEEHDFRRTADVHVASPVAPDSFPLVAQIVPVMKGLPGRAATARFEISAKPLIRNIGGVRIFLIHPDGTLISDMREHDISATLDGEPMENLDSELTLLPGLHRVQIASGTFENESLTFGVERGRVTELRIELQRPRSAIEVEAPDAAELFVDGERIGEGSGTLTLPPGEHTVVFRVGDYTVSRKLTIEPKQDYEISLTLDILITED